MPRRRRIFLGCEGASEYAYGAWLQRLCDEAELAIQLDRHQAFGGDTLSIVTRSLERRSRGLSKGRYASSIVMLDLDRLQQDGERGRKAIRLAEKHRINLIFQDLNFEGFLLRHHRGYETVRPPANQTTKELCKVWPEYRKPPIADD